MYTYRYDIINKFIEERNFSQYLEIGTRQDKCFHEINCPSKMGIDQASKTQIPLTSDEFFRRSHLKFDIIFIDGLHHSDQVQKDIQNALKALNEGGVIVLHDCKPLSYETQIVPRQTKLWNGDVWRAFLWARQELPYLTYCLDTDEGVGIIDTAYEQTNNLQIDPFRIPYQQFEKDRDRLLTLVPPEELEDWIYYSLKIA